MTQSSRSLVAGVDRRGFVVLVAAAGAAGAAGLAWHVSHIPTLSDASCVPNGINRAILSVTATHKSGALCWYVSKGDIRPTASNLRAGRGAISWGRHPVRSSGRQVIAAEGLQPGQGYVAYFLHRTACGRESAIVSTDGFVTHEGEAGMSLAPPEFIQPENVGGKPAKLNFDRPIEWQDGDVLLIQFSDTPDFEHNLKEREEILNAQCANYNCGVSALPDGYHFARIAAFRGGRPNFIQWSKAVNFMTGEGVTFEA